MSAPKKIVVYACTVDGCGYWREDRKSGVHVSFGSGSRETHKLAPTEYVLQSEALALLEDAKPTYSDPTLRRAWGRRRKDQSS